MKIMPWLKFILLLRVLDVSLAWGQPKIYKFGGLTCPVNIGKECDYIKTFYNMKERMNEQMSRLRTVCNSVEKYTIDLESVDCLKLFHELATSLHVDPNTIAPLCVNSSLKVLFHPNGASIRSTEVTSEWLKNLKNHINNCEAKVKSIVQIVLIIVGIVLLLFLILCLILCLRKKLAHHN